MCTATPTFVIDLYISRLLSWIENELSVHYGTATANVSITTTATVVNDAQ